MAVKHVSKTFAVAPQIAPEEMQHLSDQGFSSLICNRPDLEDPDQPSAELMRDAAQEAGIEFHFIPVSGGEFPGDAVSAFRKVREEAAGKVLAYCRTGTRSITLDALANPEHLSVDERVARAREAGYDLSGLRDRMGE